MRLLALAFAALTLVMASFLALPAQALACSAEWPTFEQVLKRADAIVLGSVTAALNTDEDAYPERFTLSVERVLRGRAGPTLEVTRQASLCGDGLSEADIGLRLIIASDMRFYRSTIAPYWWEFPNGRLDGWAEYPAGITTLDELADRIAALPDSATDEQTGNAATGAVWPLAVTGLLALILFLARPPAAWRRQGSTGR
jgi:myo-inositol catabolism protein IolC